MKESMFSDDKESESEEEAEDEEIEVPAEKTVTENEPSVDKCAESENSPESASNETIENEKDKQIIIKDTKDSVEECIAIDTESTESKSEPATKTVTSMYGKVYKLKK